MFIQAFLSNALLLENSLYGSYDGECYCGSLVIHIVLLAQRAHRHALRLATGAKTRLLVCMLPLLGIVPVLVDSVDTWMCHVSDTFHSQSHYESRGWILYSFTISGYWKGLAYVLWQRANWDSGETWLFAIAFCAVLLPFAYSQPRFFALYHRS